MLDSNQGYCHCCRSQTTFVVHGEWLRDCYLCSKCGSIPRQRHIHHVLDRYLPGWEKLALHESSPSNNQLEILSENYSSSFYFDDVEPGTRNATGQLCQDLQSLTFESDTFDILVTQDVFEHVFDPEAASQEIKRVLKPGGVHVFTTPKYSGIQKSFPRVSLENGMIVHLHPEEYHGSPIGDGRVIVTWTYGQDFEHLVSCWCGLNTVTYITRDRALGIDGEFLEVFVTKKGE